MKEKYAELLIKKCINLEEKEPLVIEAPTECFEFVEMLYSLALKEGSRDIHIEWG